MFSLTIKTRIDTLPFKILLIALFLVVTFCFYGMAAAATWYVDGSLNTAGNGTDWNNAFTTIQAAIDAATKDDEIWLKKGTYDLSSQVTIDKAVAIYGGFAGDEAQKNQRDWANNVTTIDGQDSVYHCFYITANAIIDGLTITGGNANGSYPDHSGGGIFNGYYSSPTINNCILSGNTASENGGGIFNDDESYPTIANCSFQENSANRYGGGISNGYNSSSSINSCTFQGNSASWGGGINNYKSSATITNCIFLDNSVSSGGGINNFEATPTVTNCTFSRNIAADWGGAIFNYTNSSPIVTNCILWGNTAIADGPEIYNYDTSSPIVTYCDILGGYGGEGNINSDPLFVDPSNDDFHLKTASPCIDKGNNNAPWVPNKDFEGDPRIVDGDSNGTATVDIGVDEYTFIDTDSDGLQDDWEMTYFGDLNQNPDDDYDGDGATNLEEYQAGTNPANNPPIANAGPDQTVGEGDTVTLDGSNSSDPDNGIASYQWTQTDGPSINLSDPTSSKPSFTAPSGGTLKFELKITDNDGLTSIDTVTITITVPVIPGVLYVDSSLTTPGDGTTWDNAFTTIQAAIDAASKDDEIWLKKGTYTLSTQVNVNMSVALYGGFAGGETKRDQRDWSSNVTTIDGQDSVYHCFYITATATIDGLTITGGNANGTWPDSSGGGIYNGSASSSVIINCTLSGNSADEDGGGIHNDVDSTPTIANCTFRENSAGGNGGAIYDRQYSSPTITNCTFLDNSATNYHGGGIYNYISSPAITNCSFSGNSAASRGGAIYNNYTSSPTITDCSFSGNSAVHDGGSIYNNYNSSPTITDCSFSGNSANLYGGGIYNYDNSSPDITNCSFSGNSADDDGGGIFNNESSPTITNCTFLDNSATNYHGGGIYNWLSSPTITNCAFTGNSASQYGGGIYNFDNSSPTIANCSFSGNSADDDGGGIYNYKNSSPAITNCAFTGNSASKYGGGIYNYGNSSPTITNCSFSGNSAANGGGAIYNFYNSSPTITNCILWGDTATDGPEINNYDTSSPIVTYCDILGGYGGEGNINTDPLFVNQGNGDLYLKSTSPCIDKGNNSATGIPNMDFEGDSRIVDGDNDGTAIVDMGMDEYTGKNRPPTVDAGPDQTVNEGDTVTIDGSNSSDPDDGIASYLWTQTSGPSINLSDPASSKPFFTAQSEGTLTFELKVTDKSGLASIDTITITIITPVISDGDLAPLGSRDGVVNVGDALVALRFALLLETPTQEDIAHGDVAPLNAQGKPDSDGAITVGDALVILRKALGIISF